MRGDIKTPINNAGEELLDECFLPLTLYGRFCEIIYMLLRKGPGGAEPWLLTVVVNRVKHPNLFFLPFLLYLVPLF